VLGISAFDRVCYNKVYGFMRRTFTNLRQDQRRHQLTAAEKVFVGEALKDLRSVRAMDAYRSLSPDVYEKCFFCQSLLGFGATSCRGPMKMERCSRRPWCCSASALVTYQGGWGVFRMPGRKHVQLGGLASEVDGN